nr:hypothetical protein [Tanacetum cinerariifolium]
LYLSFKVSQSVTLSTGSDQEDQGTFCYTKMPFGLKNAGVTYQRLVDAAFQSQIRRNLEAYIDDIIVKSKTERELIADVAKTLDNLRKINMKLNPKKCSFGVEEINFLGYMVTSKEAISAKRDVIYPCLVHYVSRTLHDAERNYATLEKLALALRHVSRRLGRYFEAHPIKVIMDQPIKQMLSKTEALGKLAKYFDELGAYAITYVGTSRQFPVQYRLKYLLIPKGSDVLLGFWTTAHGRLKEKYRSNLAHTIVMITNQPIKQLLSNPEVTGRLLKWRFKLGEHDIQYRPRTSVNGQILADFIVERPEDGTPDTLMEDREELPDPWVLFTDGSSYVDGFRAGLIIMNPEGMEFPYAAGLRIASQMGIQNLQANMDSKLVANQVNKIYIAKESSMVRYLEKVKNLASTFKGFSIKKIPRGKNKKADALSKIASTSFAHLSKQMLVEELREKAIDEKEEKLTPITSPWPFYKWGIDIAGPFPKGPGKVNGLVEWANKSLMEGIKTRL